MKWRTSVLVVLLIALVTGGALAIGLSGSKTAADGCPAGASATKYTVAIRNDKPSETHLQARRCDTLTITNTDGLTREIAFGMHDHHTSYDGVSERVLTKGESLTVTLNKTGIYHWHDHLHDEVEGYFTVQ
jgi:plastocyanin